MRVSKGSVSSCQTGDGAFLHFKSSRRATETDVPRSNMQECLVYQPQIPAQGTQARDVDASFLNRAVRGLCHRDSIIPDKITRTHSNSKYIESSITLRSHSFAHISSKNGIRDKCAYLVFHGYEVEPEINRMQALHLTASRDCKRQLCPGARVSSCS